jgi:hypothetical protein
MSRGPPPFANCSRDVLDVLVVIEQAEKHVSGQAKVRQALGEGVGHGLLAGVVVQDAA